MNENLLNKIVNIVKRFHIVSISKNAIPYQLIDENGQKATQLSQYGLTSCPIPGSDGLNFSIAGNNERMFVIPYNSSLTPNVDSGDVALFSDKNIKITLKRNKDIFIENGEIKTTFNKDGELLVEAKGGKITIDKDGKALFEGTAEIKIGEGATEPAILGISFQTIFNALVTKYNNHTHNGNVPATSSQASPSTGLELSTKVSIE